jgi:hypothetical protein
MTADSRVVIRRDTPEQGGDMRSGSGGGTRGRTRGVLVIVAVVGICAIVFSSMAAAIQSNYRTGTLNAGTPYNSIERTWFGNQITNLDTQNIGAARIWSYRSGVGYIYDVTFFLYAQSSYAACFYGDCHDSPNTRDWCQSSNTRSGSCTGHYR